MFLYVALFPCYRTIYFITFPSWKALYSSFLSLQNYYSTMFYNVPCAIQIGPPITKFPVIFVQLTCTLHTQAYHIKGHYLFKAKIVFYPSWSDIKLQLLKIQELSGLIRPLEDEVQSLKACLQTKQDPYPENYAEGVIEKLIVRRQRYMLF